MYKFKLYQLGIPAILMQDFIWIALRITAWHPKSEDSLAGINFRHKFEKAKSNLNLTCKLPVGLCP